jgi:hypothetical protein
LFIFIFAEIAAFAKSVTKLDESVLESSARLFAYTMSRVYIASLFLEHAHWSRDAIDVACAHRWVNKQPLSLVSAHLLDTMKTPQYQAESRALGLASKL